MKTLKKRVLSIGLIGLLNSCQSTNQVLSNSDKRTEIMNKIASDESMSKEMMGMLMGSKSAKMAMMKEHRAKMMEMMKADPEMMKNMMSEMTMHNPEMMKAHQAKMMAMMHQNPEMCKAMMGNGKMMDMMQNMKDDKMDMNKMKTKPVKEEEHKSHH